MNTSSWSLIQLIIVIRELVSMISHYLVLWCSSTHNVSLLLRAVSALVVHHLLMTIGWFLRHLILISRRRVLSRVWRILLLMLRIKDTIIIKVINVRKNVPSNHIIIDSWHLNDPLVVELVILLVLDIDLILQLHYQLLFLW